MKKKIKIFLITIFVCLLLSIILLNIFGKKVLPIFMNYATSEVKNISTAIINKAVINELNNFNDDMINISKNSKDEIQMIDFNSKLVNRLLASITEEVLVDLKKLETGSDEITFEKINYDNGIIYEIPIGKISDNVFINNLGPKIPVKFDIIGDVISNINTEVKEYGINNALVKISVNIKVSEKVIMPFLTDTVDVSVDIPISLKLIQGSIPEYYGGIFSRNSSILSVPGE